MPFVSGCRVVVEQVDECRWRLVEPVRYVGGQGDAFEVPAGYVTDFASVPRIAVWLIPVFGRYTLPAILHDRLLTDYLAAGAISSVDADGLFRRSMREMGVAPVRRYLMWAGVRWAALFSPLRRPGWWRTAPAVLAISVPALPLAVPMLAVVAGLAYYGAAELGATGGRRKGTLST
jgi:hypothetical protein